jgi:hypothetical protein
VPCPAPKFCRYFTVLSPAPKPRTWYFHWLTETLLIHNTDADLRTHTNTMTVQVQPIGMRDGERAA